MSGARGRVTGRRMRSAERRSVSLSWAELPGTGSARPRPGHFRPPAASSFVFEITFLHQYERGL